MVRLFGGVLLEGKQGSSKKMILFFLCTLLIRNIDLYRLWWLEVSMHTHTHTHTHTHSIHEVPGPSGTPG